MLPDRSLLIGQKLVENAKLQKFKRDILNLSRLFSNRKLKENINLVSLCEYYDLDVTQNALEKASAGGKYTTWQQGDPF